MRLPLKTCDCQHRAAISNADKLNSSRLSIEELLAALATVLDDELAIAFYFDRARLRVLASAAMHLRRAAAMLSVESMPGGYWMAIQ